jgi:predicted ATPase/class 3 adenylate cyclase
VARDLPAGTVTFLFTDVEGSTQLLRSVGKEAYAQALTDHRRVVRECVSAHGGVEVDTQGDAFFVAFPTAPGALSAASAIVDGLAGGPISLRMGLHTGTPLLTSEGYMGEDVHRAARIAACGHGGQVLVSSATAQLVEADLRDLGIHRLKDLSAPERMYQLGGEDFPALRSLYRTNLPVPVTPFLGRERELDEVVNLLQSTRMLTLTGPGGTGKTRLALQAAGSASDAYPDGVYWVPLESLRDPAVVMEAAAQVLGATHGLVTHIADKRLLLILDNFEHVVEAAPELADLLSTCPNVRLLVTSRELLQLPGEQAYPVLPLDPDDGTELFLARARAADPTFDERDGVGELCARLDNLPLALELAAARVRVLTMEQLLERLTDRLSLLKAGRGADPRQQTLAATIEWSYELLSADEQLLFRRLSVFGGGCTLEAAEEVAEAELDTLQSLVDKSLVRFSEGRYWMLETIRAFAEALLATSGEDARLRDRHLAFYLGVVEEAEPQLTGPDQRAWFERLALEQENVREALAFACDLGDGERALMLAGTIWRFWWTRGQIDEASRWYERAFAVADGASETARSRGLFGAAHMAEARGDVENTRELFEQAADLLRRIGATRWLILALAHLCGTYEPERAEVVYLEALGLADESGDKRGAAIVKGNLATLLVARGEDERAATLLEEAAADHRELGDVYGVASSLAGLADLAHRRGERELAAAMLRESVELSYSIRDTLSLSWALAHAATVVLARGDARTAARLCVATDALCKEHGIEPDPLLRETTCAARSVLAEGFNDVWADGVNLDLASAVELAVGSLGATER